MSEDPKVECPCADAHRRLQDVHEHVHRAVERYLDPDDFRMELNSALTHARSVSFLIQKRKATLVGYDTWYPAWVEKSKENPILGWAVGARNRIVKEEDLKTASSMRLVFYGERLAEMIQEMDVPPTMNTEVAARQLGGYVARQSVKQPAWIRVERTWMDQELPGHELCAALREVLTRLTDLVQRAHTAHAITECAMTKRSRECVDAGLPVHYECMQIGNPLGSVLINAKTGELRSSGFKFDRKLTQLSPSDVERLSAKYERPKLPARLRDQAEARLGMLRDFVRVDGGVAQMVILEGVHNELHHVHVFFDPDEPREVVFDQIVESQAGWDFHTVVLLSELWLYPLDGPSSLLDLEGKTLVTHEGDPYDGPRYQNGVEAIAVEVVDRDGSAFALTQPFARTTDGVVFGDIERREGMENALPMMRPVWRRWPAWEGWKPKAVSEAEVLRSTPPRLMGGSSFHRGPSPS